MGPGETRRPGAPGPTRASTASCSPARTRSGCELFHSFSKRWPRPCIVEMGGKNPAIVTRNADLEEAAEGIMRSRVRVRRPEVLGELARLRRAAGPRRARPAARREDRADRRSATRSSARTGWARSSTSRRSTGTSRRSREARRDGTVFTGGEHLTDGDLGARLLRRADGRRRPAGRPPRSSATSCSRRSPRSTRSTRSTRRWRWRTTRSTG